MLVEKSNQDIQSKYRSFKGISPDFWLYDDLIKEFVSPFAEEISFYKRWVCKIRGYLCRGLEWEIVT